MVKKVKVLFEITGELPPEYEGLEMKEILDAFRIEITTNNIKLDSPRISVLSSELYNG
jgi:hypothetical protein